MGSQLARTRPGSTEIRFASQTEPTRINDFIWMSEGASNSYLVNTGDGDVLINTGLGVEAPVHKRCFDQVRSGPLRYILITQGHVDHVGGIELFREPETQVIAQENIHACQADDKRIQGLRYRRNMRFFPEHVQKMYDAIEYAEKQGLPTAQAEADPEITFHRRYELTCGDLRFELISVPGGETIDSALILLPEHGILFSGNALGPLFPHMPNLYTIRGDKIRYVPGYLEVCDTILDLDPELLITGHFDPIAGRELIRDELGRLRDAVDYVHGRTLEGMNAGKDVFTLMDEVRLPPELQVGEDYGTVPWTVRAIWEGYVGWFRFESTTELYSLPVGRMYGELAELAGADALAGRAEAHAEAGEPLRAIHLAEIALAGDAENRRAWQAYLTAHRQLLAESQPRNRWQKYWLEGEIGRARERLEPERPAEG